MARMRGVVEFDTLWSRRTTLEGDDGLAFEVMSLPDLVAAKKTQRDKDWPMLRRLIEANYAQQRSAPGDDQLTFWLLESRTPKMLVELASRFPTTAKNASRQRALLNDAISGVESQLWESLAAEQEAEREADRSYWAPLKRELEALRHR